MNSTRSIVSFAAFVFSLVELGCGGADDGSSGGPSDAPIRTVEAALAAPTGNVSATTAKGLLVKWQSYQSVHAAFDAVLFLGTAAAGACLDGSDESGSYDLDCLTLGQVRGRLIFRALGPLGDAGLLGLVAVKLENACVGAACVNAEATVEIEPADCAALTTLAVTATVAQAGQSDSFSFGVQGGIGRGQLLPRVVYLDGESGSLVVDAGADPSAPSLVSGADRSFECSFGGGGGQCTGTSASFSF